MDKYGFIITRHVNSEITNRYWNQNVKLIRTFYPLRQIVIIDDNSKPEFVKADHQYKNLTVIQSEYPGRGELLPYIYYLKYKWFSNAVIIHDSLFIHKRIPFENLNMPVLPLWHHEYDKEHLNNLLRMCSVLSNNSNIMKTLIGSEINILGLKKQKHYLCFGGQCYINLNFLETLENKYMINVNSEETVLSLKYQIKNILNINVQQQRLIFLGYPMVDETILNNLGVKENSVIHLLLCMI